jgi:hypothetical protein
MVQDTLIGFIHLAVQIKNKCDNQLKGFYLVNKQTSQIIVMAEHLIKCH